MLIIHSLNDKYTPVKNAYELLQADPQAEFWETTIHNHARNYNEDPVNYVKRVSAFFKEHLK